MPSHPTPPSVGAHLVIAFPAPHVLQLTLNRPKQLNAMTDALEADLRRVLDWFEVEPSLWVVILTGHGRAFCAGQDLKAWAESNKNQELQTSPEGLQLASVDDSIQRMKKGGFGSVSIRRSAKPIIAAVDGIAMGGGMEMILNCDLVVATTRSTFALPEVCRGVVAAQGGIPRLAKIAGHHRAAEMLLTGLPLTAQDAYDRFGFVNRLVPVTSSTTIEAGQSLIQAEALKLASSIVANSPEAVMVTKESLVHARDAVGEDEGIDDTTFKSYRSERSRALYAGKNIAEGLAAFKEKRPTQWTDAPKAKGLISKL